MNKFSKLVKALSLILQKPYLLNNVLKDEIVFKADFQKAFPSTVFKQIRLVDLMETDEVQITPYAFLSGSSLATDFALLQLLCRKYQVKDYLEIGTWRGESAANVAPYVDSVCSFNLGDEQFIIQKGMRIAQMVIVPVVQMTFERVDLIDMHTERGESGFGSTGVNPEPRIRGL
jgi:hypothetical protein